MKFLAVASLAFVGLAKLANAQESEEAAGKRNYPILKKGVRATFTTAVSGATGSVQIFDATDVSVKMEIIDFDAIAAATGQSWATCSTGGILWSVESFWDDAVDDENSGSSCDDVLQGGRYDPSLTCSSLSQYAVNPSVAADCADISTNASLFDYIDHLTANGTSFPPPGKPSCADPTPGVYNCYPCLYKQFSNACEVGDMGGKYGNLRFHTGCVREAAESEEGAVSTEGMTEEAAGYYNNYNYCHRGTHAHMEKHDRFMDKPSVFDARSVKISCNDGTPIMCAKLIPFTGY